MMWETYDVLISSADSDIRIRDFAAGTYWTAVLTEDGVLGLSPSIHERYQRFPFTIEPAAGMKISEMAPNQILELRGSIHRHGGHQRLLQPAGPYSGQCCNISRRKTQPRCLRKILRNTYERQTYPLFRTHV